MSNENKGTNAFTQVFDKVSSTDMHMDDRMELYSLISKLALAEYRQGLEDGAESLEKAQKLITRSYDKGFADGYGKSKPDNK